MRQSLSESCQNMSSSPKISHKSKREKKQNIQGQGYHNGQKI